VERGTIEAPCLRQFSWNAVRMWQRWARQDTKEPVMGLGKKAKREAKAVKGKTKKDASKAKHKGKKVKNAAKH